MHSGGHHIPRRSIAHANDPVRMAHAMRHACEAGRLAHQSGRIGKKLYATAGSPWTGVISHTPSESPRSRRARCRYTAALGAIPQRATPQSHAAIAAPGICPTGSRAIHRLGVKKTTVPT